MAPHVNEFNQPVGEPVPNWYLRPMPPRSPLAGRYCRLEPADAALHAADLYEAYSEAPDGRDWTYMFAGPFGHFDAYRDYLASAAAAPDLLHHAIIDSITGKAVGTAALMRIDQAHGVVEVGHIAYSPRMKRSRAGTEAMFLLMRRVFEEMGYRRYEWKCDHLNAPSRAAALRYGFQFEGIFRQAVVYKGRSRDTAWFSIIDSEWPAIRSGFEQWLLPSNFDAEGNQVRRLADLIAEARKSS